MIYGLLVLDHAEIFVELDNHLVEEAVDKDGHLNVTSAEPCLREIGAQISSHHLIAYLLVLLAKYAFI
jgi:hypothetical protein